jgi:hypothetical protein
LNKPINSEADNMIKSGTKLLDMCRQKTGFGESASHLFLVMVFMNIFKLYWKFQGCGSGSGLDPDSET